jgi:hypothetical protein
MFSQGRPRRRRSAEVATLHDSPRTIIRADDEMRRSDCYTLTDKALQYPQRKIHFYGI